MKRFTTLVALVGLASLVPNLAVADPVAPITPGIRASISQVRFAETTHPPSLQSPSVATTNRRAQRAKAAIGLGFLGMFAGGGLGAAIEGQCHCDDPGLTGGLVGASIGTVVGAILGWNLGQ
jgi:hypothetical protein